MYKVLFVIFLTLTQTDLVHANNLNQSITKIQSVQVDNHNKDKNLQVDIHFEKPYQANALKAEVERNFVQLVLNSVSMAAAKQVVVDKGLVDKVFVYPYMPSVVRLRVLYKDSSEWTKGKVKVQVINAKHLRLIVPNGVVPVAKQTTPKTTTSSVSVAPVETKKLVEQVMAETKEIDINNPDSIKEALTKKIEPEKKSELPKESEVTPRLSKNFLKMLVGFSLVIGLFLAFAFFLKKYASKLKKLPFGKKERLIQVIATHYLGHKKSISLVKVTGEYMVVGVSNDGISLISRLGAEMNVEKYLEDRFWGGSFEKQLGQHIKDEGVKGFDGIKDMSKSMSNDMASIFSRPEPTEQVQAAPAVHSKTAGIRASIKDKISGLKQLS